MRLVLTLVCALAPALAVQGQSPAPLQRLLQAELGRIPARAGIYVKHLKTGEEAAVLADERFNSASVIKIPVLVMAYQMAAKGTLDLNARVTVSKADKRGGSGVLRYHDVGLQPTVRDVMMQMIITSDNTATDIAIVAVDPVLVKIVGAEALWIEPDSPGGGFAHFGTTGCGQQWISDSLRCDAVNPSNQIDSGHNIAPLIIAA
jgi:hypothetical protein